MLEAGLGCQQSDRKACVLSYHTTQSGTLPCLSHRRERAWLTAKHTGCSVSVRTRPSPVLPGDLATALIRSPHHAKGVFKVAAKAGTHPYFLFSVQPDYLPRPCYLGTPWSLGMSCPCPPPCLGRLTSPSLKIFASAWCGLPASSP